MHYYNIFLLKLIGENIELVDLYNCEEEGDCQIALQPPRNDNNLVCTCLEEGDCHVALKPPRNDSIAQEAPKFNGSAKGFKL